MLRKREHVHDSSASSSSSCSSASLEEEHNEEPPLTPSEISQLRLKAAERERREHRTTTTKQPNKVTLPSNNVTTKQEKETIVPKTRLIDPQESLGNASGVVSVTEIYNQRGRALEKQQHESTGHDVATTQSNFKNSPFKTNAELQKPGSVANNAGNSGITPMTKKVFQIDGHPQEAQLLETTGIEQQHTGNSYPRMGVSSATNNNIVFVVAINSTDQREENGPAIHAQRIELGEEREKIRQKIIAEATAAEEIDKAKCEASSQVLLIIFMTVSLVLAVGLGVGLRNNNQEPANDESDQTKSPVSPSPTTAPPSSAPTVTFCPCFTEEQLLELDATTDSTFCSPDVQFGVSFNIRNRPQIAFCTGLDCQRDILIIDPPGVGDDRLCMTLRPLQDSTIGAAEYDIVEISEPEGIVCQSHIISVCPLP